MRALVIVKLAHTLAWASFAGCIMGLPIAALAGRFRLAALFASATLVETGILAANGWRCPLTDIAARFTDDRRENFDIYLPRWLARHNKAIFGTAFIAGGLIALGAAVFRYRK